MVWLLIAMDGTLPFGLAILEAAWFMVWDFGFGIRNSLALALGLVGSGIWQRHLEAALADIH